MLAFRKLFLALVVLAVTAGIASAQNRPLSCVAQAAGTPSIRAEGVTELVGDVLILCYDGTPKGAGVQLDQVNIQVFSSPSINITSRLLVGSSPGTGSFSEALLFIDEPSPATQTLCGTAGIYPESVPAGSGQPLIAGVCGLHSGTGNGVGVYNGTLNGNGFYRGNTYQARQPSANSLIWQGIPFDAPGTLTTRVIRLTNVRVNASQLGVPSGGQASVSLVISTSASGVGNPIALPITNPAPTVAIAQNSLTFSVVDPRTCLQCQSANKDFAGDVSKALAGSTDSNYCDNQRIVLRYQELFPSVFRRRNQAQPAPAFTGTIPPTPVSQDVLGTIYQTETGFYKASGTATWPSTIQNLSLVSGTSGGTLGLADHGTRLIARFNNVQNGVQVWVRNNADVLTVQGSASSTLVTGQARMVTTDPNGAGPFSATPTGATNGLNLSQVSIVGGAGSAVWEIVNADTTTIEKVDLGVVFAWVSNTSANLPALGTATANGSLAPISTAAGASNTAALPRFVDTASNKTLMTINSCRTNILFPFVSNQAGFDTGLAIANTSKDPFGTALQTGACSVNFYGTIGTSKVCLNYSSPSITGGEHFVWSLSSGGAVNATAGFQGYVIAQCNFQYGHGFAYISDLGSQKLAMGYLALILDAGLDSRTGSRSETLGH